MLEKLGHFVFRHPRAVILAWLAIIVACGVAAPRVYTRLAHGATQPSHGEASDGYKLLKDELGIHSDCLLLVFESQTLRADDALFMDQMDAAMAGLEGIDNIDPPVTYANTGDTRLLSRDGHVTYATIGVKGDMYDACRTLPVVRERLNSQPDLDVFVTGQSAAFYDTEAASMADMKSVETFTFPLVAIVLVLVFGSLVAAGLPLMVGAASLVLTMGMLFVLSHFIEITSSSLTVISFLGLGCGVDYALIMVSRFREEMRGGRPLEGSIVTTCSTSGKAILFSAVTSVIGLVTLTTFDNPVIRSLGIGGTVVVFLCLVAALTLLPAVLSVLGGKVNRLTLFHLTEEKGTFWQRMARWEMSHPLVVLLIIVPPMVILSLPVLGVNPSNISFSQIPKETEARQGFEKLKEGFGAGEVAPILLCVSGNGEITDWHNIYMLHCLTRLVERDDRVGRVESIVNLDPSITREQYAVMYARPEAIPDPRIQSCLDQLTSETTTLVRVFTNGDPMAPQARELVNSLRNLEVGSLDIVVTGPVASDEDMVAQVYSHFLWIILFIVAASYLSLLLLFKSVLLPLKAILLNIASVAATFGVLVFVFQQGHFSGVLDFTTDGTINFQVLVMVFCIVFGLSMDYEVYLLSRVKEIWEQTGDNTASVALGLARTGRIITSAAAIMVVVFGTFIIADVLVIKLVGVGLALSILLDATVIRLFLAPALMRIMGKWNWWAPSFLRRLWGEAKRPSAMA